MSKDHKSVLTLQQEAERFVRTRFGDACFESMEERALRLHEEVVELCQSLKVDPKRLSHNQEKVYSRAVGEPMQELAGVVFTALAMGQLMGVNVATIAELELGRCRQLPIQHFKDRHAEKVRLGMSGPAVQASGDAEPGQEVSATCEWRTSNEEAVKK